MPALPDQTVAPPPTAQESQHTRSLTPEEAEDFAEVLGIRPEAICTAFRTDAPAADERLASYDDLVADPIKSRVASNPAFFAEVKRDIATELVARYLPGTSPAELRVLDVGCGTGELMRALDAHFGRVQGCDPSLSMICRAGPDATYMTSGMELPFDTASFDLATCACVYHHIEPDKRLEHLKETRRILRPGGALLIFEHNPRNPLTQYIVQRCPIDAAAHLLTAAQTKRLLRDAGFERVRTRYYLFLPQRLYRWFGRLERYLSISTLGGQYCTVGRNPG